MKKLLQILAPFATLIAVILIFYIVGCVFAIMGIISDFFKWVEMENIFEDIMSFFFIFSGEYPIGSSVVSVIVWISLTIFAEILIESYDDWEHFFVPRSHSHSISNEGKVEKETTSITTISPSIPIEATSLKEEMSVVEDKSPLSKEIGDYASKRSELLEFRQELINFSCDREKMYLMLGNSNMDSLKNKSIAIINRNRRARKFANSLQNRSLILALTMPYLPLIIGFTLTETVGKNWNVGIIMLYGLLCGIILFMAFFAIFIFGNEDMFSKKFENDYTNTINTFIQNHKNTYARIIGITNPNYLEIEICDPTKIQEIIANEFKNIDTQITEFDHQIKLLQSLS